MTLRPSRYVRPRRVQCLLPPQFAHNPDILKVRQPAANQPLEVPLPGGHCCDLAQGSVDGVLLRLRVQRILGRGLCLFVDVDEDPPFLGVG
jgi:hypothetical protein